MAVAVGKTVYRCDAQNNNLTVFAYGQQLSNDEMKSALQNEVYDRLYDIPENEKIISVLSADLSDTGFSSEKIKEIWQEESFENWHIGEALAETYLVDNQNAIFPWNISRDIKRENSSLPGMDIIGYQTKGEDVYFLFGEVKTSSDSTHPPQVVEGRTGLKSQVEYLLSYDNIRRAIRYLAYRNHETENYKKAFRNYILGNEYVVYGILVRDVEPDSLDIKAKANNLVKSVKNGQEVTLLSLYVPENQIDKFSSIIEEEKEWRAMVC